MLSKRIIQLLAQCNYLACGSGRFPEAVLMSFDGTQDSNDGHDRNATSQALLDANMLQLLPVQRLPRHLLIHHII